MDWDDINNSTLNNHEVAEQILQLYTKSLQSQSALKNILSEFSVLDYFGKCYCGQENVAAHLISKLHGSNYELSSLTITDSPPFLLTDIESKSEQEKSNEDLDMVLISSPKSTFPSLTLSTPIRSFSEGEKRSLPEPLDSYNHVPKIQKTETNGEQSSSNKKTDENGIKVESMSFSPRTLQSLLPNHIRHLTAYGTIRYPKRGLSTMDPKKMKQHSLFRQRDRFCHLCIGYECDEDLNRVANCKIWTIKYSVSSRVAPRNLLKSFIAVE